MENNLDSILSQISSNPDLMSKISEIASSSSDNKIADVVSLISPLVSSKNTATVSNETVNAEPVQEDASNSTEENTSKGASNTLSLGASFGKSIMKNKALLIALKPYLSKGGCDMIDSVIKLSQIADVIKLI